MMDKDWGAIAMVALAALGFCGAAGAQSLTGGNLRCEYLENPLGIAVEAPRLSWTVESAARAQVQSAYRILVASSAEKLAANTGDLWDSGKVASNQTNQVVYAGTKLASRAQCYWKVMVWDGQDKGSGWSTPASWSMGLLKDSDWQAQWIEHDTEALNEDPELLLPPSPYVRKEFPVGKPVARATVYASALGLYELSINGKRVGQDLFTPGWTDYNKRVYYQTYDVTPLLTKGTNAIGAVLSNGWYAGYVGFGLLQNRGKAGRAFYGDRAALLTQLEIEFEDGTHAVIGTDGTWKASTGPIRGNDIQMGETYDARKEIPGWDTPGFDDKAWKAATPAKAYEGKVESYPGVTVQRQEAIRPVGITQPKEGVHIFNMGQNFAGRVRLKVTGPAGTKIVLRFGEMLHKDGSLMTENLRKARAIDTYILKGGGEEIWEPRFTYHGFQYVEVTGFPGTPTLDAITGIVLHSATPVAGHFECDNAMVNQLYSNINWTQRANFFEVPTDCPQRDERLGWTGDAQVYVRSATCNRDVAAFFTKWFVDLEDAQRPSGAYPDFAPLPYLQNEPSPAWMDAGVICPYTIYKVYGDTRVIERHYDSMTTFMGYLTKHSKDYRRSPLHHCWGDWLCVGKQTSHEFIATAYFAYDAKLMAEMAAAIGKTEDAKKYSDLFENIRKAIADAWVSEDGRIEDDTQTCYALALYMGLLPKELEAKAAARLAQLIKENNGHLATGFLGVKHALPALSEHGYAELAFSLLTKETYPSWGYSVVNGATSIWERWNSYTKEDGIHDPGMNSFSHYSFGAVCEWMFAHMAGIDTDGPGFKRIIIRPRPGGAGIHTAKASYDSINGKIASSWVVKGGKITLNVTIPANTTAKVYVPSADAGKVTEGGKPAAESAGVRFLWMEDGAAVYGVGSGDYVFESPIAAPGKDQETVDCTVASYYFPNYHPDARNQKYHGEGWTEWELVKQAKPRFEGHQQPNVPLWGYTDESDPKVMEKKIDAAADHGIDAFIYDWYYYDDGPFLERGLEQGFMKAANNDRLKFGLMWANHNWVDIHPARVEGERKLLYPGQVKPETFDTIMDYVIENYFKHPSYWTIDGCPYFSVYELYRLIESFGGIENTAKALERFRAKTKAAGFPDLHLNAVVWGVKILPGETTVKNPAELVKKLGFDSTTSYVWIHHVPLSEFPQTPYGQVMDKSTAHWAKTVEEFPIPYHPNVTMGWDSSPRCHLDDPFINKGYPFMASMSGNTPEAFKKALGKARDFLKGRPACERILTINCWNEWTEGSYLEPDTVHKMAYLEAVKEVFGKK